MLTPQLPLPKPVPGGNIVIPAAGACDDFDLPDCRADGVLALGELDPERHHDPGASVPAVGDVAAGQRDQRLEWLVAGVDGILFSEAIDA